MELANNMSNVTSHTNTSNVSTDAANIIFKDGPLFQAVETELMKVNIWPLIFMFVYAVSGFVGNSIVLYVYWFKWKKTNTRVYILCLGFLDFVNCFFNMPVEIAILWNPISFDFHYLCKISRGCTYVINNTGSLVFVAVAIERYMLVYHPLKYLKVTARLAKIMCLIAFIIASIFSWPPFVFYGSHVLTIPVGKYNVRGTTCLIADDYIIYKGTYILAFTSVLFALLIVVFVVLTVLYIAIGRKIHTATSADMKMDENTSTRSLSRSIVSAITGFGFTQSADMMSQSRTSSISLKDTDSISSNGSTTPGILRSQPSKMEEKKSKNKSGMSRRFSSIKSRPTRKNTVMMRMVTIAFMLSFTPFLIILVIRYTYTSSEYYLTLDRSGKIVYSVFLRFYFINSMVNPFIYGFMDIRFRKMVKDIFKNLFCCCSCCRH